MRFGLTYFVIVLVSLIPQSGWSQSETEVRIEGTTLIIDGPLRAGLFKIIQGLDTSKVKTLLIDSAGGDIDEGMNIGEFVRDRKLDVKVDNLCLSSCANYIFVAGQTKDVGLLRGAICYHGNLATSWPTREKYEKEIRQELIPLKVPSEKIPEIIKNSLDQYEQRIERERKFFASLGMSSTDLFKMSNYPGSQWVCPTERGFPRFGVKNIKGATTRGLVLGEQKIFVDDGINGLQMESCEKDLETLREEKCGRQSAFVCLAKNKQEISNSCRTAIGIDGGAQENEAGFR